MKQAEAIISTGPMKIGYANGTGATATQGLAYNGGAWSTISWRVCPRPRRR